MGHNFNQYAAEGNRFLKEYAKSLGDQEDIAKAGRTLKSVLHALRNQLTTEESIQLISQFPMFLKAIYVDQWSTKKNNKPKTIDGLLQQVKQIHGSVAEKDFNNDEEVEHAIVVSFIELRKYVSLGEFDDIKSVLPKELKPLLNSVLMV